MEEDINLKWVTSKKTGKLTPNEIWLIFFLICAGPFLTFLTRFYPFSLLWQDRKFHYRFKDVKEAVDLLDETALKQRFWFKLLSFERNRLFLKIEGRFNPIDKKAGRDKLIKHMEKTFKDRDVFITYPEKELVKFSFVRK